MYYLLRSCRKAPDVRAVHTVQVERVGNESRCQQVTNWLTWAVSYPAKLGGIVYNTYQLATKQELRGPLQKVVDPNRALTFVPHANIYWHVTILSQLFHALYKEPRNDPQGLLRDQENRDVFLPFLQQLYPEEAITEDDFLLSCSKDHVPAYRRAILNFIGPAQLPSIRQHLDGIVEETLNYFSSKEDRVNVSAATLANIYTTAVISRVLLNHPGPFQEYEKIHAAISFVTKYLMLKRWRNLTEAENLELKQSIECIKGAIDVALGCKEPFSLVGSLRAENVPEKRIKTTLYLMFFAGSETSSIVLKYLLWQLGQHPECQEEMLKETITAEQVVAEGLRLCPPAYVVGRRAAADLNVNLKNREGETIGTYRIDQGEGFLLADFMAARDPNLFPEPQLFNPKRFVPKQIPLPWLPFGEGVHACPGQWIAKAELTLFLTALTKRYTIESTLRQPDLKQNGYININLPEVVRLVLRRREEELKKDK